MKPGTVTRFFLIAFVLLGDVFEGMKPERIQGEEAHLWLVPRGSNETRYLGTAPTSSLAGFRSALGLRQVPQGLLASEGEPPAFELHWCEITVHRPAVDDADLAPETDPEVN